MTRWSKHSESCKPPEADTPLAHASDGSISYDQKQFFAQVPRVLAQPLLIFHLGSRWGLVVSDTPRPRFTTGERTPGTHWIRGWVGSRAGLDAGARRKILCPCWVSNPDRPARSQTPYCLSYHGSPNKIIFNRNRFSSFGNGRTDRQACPCHYAFILRAIKLSTQQQFPVVITISREVIPVRYMLLLRHTSSLSSHSNAVVCQMRQKNRENFERLVGVNDVASFSNRAVY
jgi:hypothetical protein